MQKTNTISKLGLDSLDEVSFAVKTMQEMAASPHGEVWMGGADRGFEADAMLCPDENLAVIVMSNGPNSGDYYTLFMTSDVMQMLFDQ